MFQDTIAAIATADAMGAISVIRISGGDAIQIVTDLTGKDLAMPRDIQSITQPSKKEMNLLTKYSSVFSVHQNPILVKML